VPYCLLAHAWHAHPPPFVVQAEVLDKNVIGEDACIGHCEVDVSFALSTSDVLEPFAQRPLRLQLRDATQQHFQVGT
jgi:hypothetical protein